MFSCAVLSGQPVSAHMKGDILAYVSGACHSVRSSLWKPNGVSVRLYAPLRAMPAANSSGQCANRLAAAWKQAEQRRTM